MKHLNTDIKFLEFPDGCPSEDFGKRAKATADDVRALKGIQSKKGNRFSGSGNSNKTTMYMSQSSHQNWGTNSWSQRSVFSRLNNPSSQAKVHHSGSLTDLQNKFTSNQLSFFQLSLPTVFMFKTMDSGGHPSTCTIIGF